MESEAELAFYTVGNRIGELLILSVHLRENTRETQHYGFLWKTLDRLRSEIDWFAHFLPLDNKTSETCEIVMQRCFAAVEKYPKIEDGLDPCLNFLRRQLTFLADAMSDFASGTNPRGPIWFELGRVIVQGCDPTLNGLIRGEQLNVDRANWKWEDRPTLDQLIGQLGVDLESLFSDPQSLRNRGLGEPPLFPPLLWGCACVHAARLRMEQRLKSRDQRNISVNINEGVVFIEGQTVGVGKTEAVLVDVLLNNPDGISGPTMKKEIALLAGGHFSRLKNAINKKIPGLIVGKPKYRIDLSRTRNTEAIARGDSGSVARG